ncbi:MAG: lipopolysaccharide export system protein LptA [Candidatus Latescibacterota bacterium]
MLSFSLLCFLCRAPRKGARLFFVVLLLGLYQCAPIEQDAPRVEIPSADAEARDVLLQLVRPGTRLQIRAAQVHEYSKEQVAIADGGVEVTFYNAEGQEGVHLRAERLRLDHRSGSMGLAGGVVLRSNDSLEVQADSLLWEAEGEHLRVPGTLMVIHAEGREQGRDLETDSAAEAWLLYDVVGRWNFSAEDETVEVRAGRERSQRLDGQLQIRYEDAELRFAGMRLTGDVAHWVPGDRQAYFGGGVEGVDSSGHFSARDVEVDLQARRLIARGSVKSERGSAKLEAEEFVEEWQAHRSLASGYPARYERDGREIEARQIRYIRDEDRVEADSQVVFREGERLLGARHLVYVGQNATVAAQGAVLLKGPELEGILSGDSLFFDLDVERGWIMGSPTLRRTDKGTLQLSADSMYFDLGAKTLSGSDHFVLESDGIEASARVGHYSAENEQVSFAGSVVLEQDDREGEYRSRIESDSLVVTLEEGIAREVWASGELQGKIEMGVDRVSWIEGRGGRMWLADNKLERIELDANADATYHHLEKGEVSRFRGQRMFLYFDENGLYQVRVEGDAKLVSRLVRDDGKPAVNEVVGQQLEIDFIEGSIASVQVGPETEGTYFPPEKEE